MSKVNLRSEADDWARALAGDGEAFGRVFDSHKDRVYRRAYLLVGSVQDAEDVTALVFFEAWRSRARVRVVDGSIVAWLLVTTRYTSQNQERARRRHRLAMSMIQAPERPADPTETVDALLDFARTGIDVREAFFQLSERDRDILTLCVVEELTLRQASEVLRVPVGTVKSRLHRAKANLAHLVTAALSDQSA